MTCVPPHWSTPPSQANPAHHLPQPCQAQGAPRFPPFPLVSSAPHHPCPLPHITLGIRGPTLKKKKKNSGVICIEIASNHLVNMGKTDVFTTLPLPVGAQRSLTLPLSMSLLKFLSLSMGDFICRMSPTRHLLSLSLASSGKFSNTG